MHDIPAGLLAAALALVVVPGCHGRTARRPLVVFAASSLTESFEALEESFEATHPEVDVQLAFAGSQALRVQIEQGARADVFASAAPVHMQALVAAGLVDASEVFARNVLVIAVPLDDREEIDALSDLSHAERIVLGAPEVPVGIYARELLARADGAYGPGFADAVRAHVVSEESNVRLVLSKVELGEADAAIVYRTDAIASGKVRAVSIPAELDVPAEYTAGVVANSSERETARAWLDHLRDSTGRTTLERFGFEPPPSSDG